MVEWKWHKVEGEGLITRWTLAGPETVLCRFWGDAPPGPEALKIAAAPELYEALTQILGWREHDRNDMGDAIRFIEETARTALSRARGEPNDDS